MLTILCIDDDTKLLSLREALLKAEGFNVLTAKNARTAIACASQHHVDAIVLDYSMPRMNGELLAQLLKQKFPKVPIILYSGCLDIPERVFALVDGFVDKCGGSMFLVRVLRSVLSRKKPSTSERRLRRTG
jgi:DNA-binding NtrC family response regulator